MARRARPAAATLAPRARRRVREPALAGRARRLADRSRERLHAYAEKAMREAGDHTALDRRRTRRTRRRSTPRSTRRTTTRRCAPCSTSCVDAVLEPGRQQRAGRQAGRADDAGRARRLPGHRALGPQPGRPRQPAPRRLRRCGARGARPATGHVPTGAAKLAGRRAGADAAPRPAGAVHALHPGAGRGPGRRPRAGLRPRRCGHGRDPAAGRPRRRGRLGRHRSPAGVPDGPAAGRRRRWPAQPVALLVERP